MKVSDTGKSRILLVEDEETLAIGLEYNLKAEGYFVEVAKDGREAVNFFEKGEFDLIVLDLMLPYLSGFEVAKKVRESSPQIPILILTAKTGVKDKVKGFELGADDYMTKPFNLQELLLRIRRMLERKSWYKTVTDSSPACVFGDNAVNFSNLSYTTSKGEFKLTYMEAMLLKYLVEREGQVVGREELLENVWQMNPDIETRTVDNFIARLRKYFETNVSSPQFIKSVRGAGYIFDRGSNN